MLNSENKIRASRDKKKNILTRVDRKKILNEAKNHNPPFKLNGRSLIKPCKSKKNRQHNGQKKKYKRTKNDPQSIHIKLKIE